MNLLRHTDLRVLSFQSSASTHNSTGIDLANREGCLFIASFSTLAEGASSIKIKIQGSTVGTTAGFVSYAGSGISSTAIVTNSRNRRVAVLDLYKPLKRYARVRIEGSSSGVKYLNSVLAMPYGVRRPASTALYGSTHIAGSTLMVSPTSS